MKSSSIGALAMMAWLAASAAQALPVAQSFEATRFADIAMPGTPPEPDLPSAPQGTQALMQLVALARSVAQDEPAAEELLWSAELRLPAIGTLSHPLRAGSGRWGHTELPGGLPALSDRRLAMLSRP